MQADILSGLSKWSRPAACSDVLAALAAKRKDSHSIACRRTDVLQGLPSSTIRMWRRSLEDRTDKERRRRWKKNNKTVMTNQTKTYQTKMTIGREVENLAGQNAENPRQRKNKCSSAWKGFEGGRRSSASHMHSVHFPTDKVGYTSESPRGKTSTASRCLAPVRSQEQDLDRHASLPSRLSTVRMAQMVVQWVIQAQWRPLLTKWKLVRWSATRAVLFGFAHAPGFLFFLPNTA